MEVACSSAVKLWMAREIHDLSVQEPVLCNMSRPDILHSASQQQAPRDSTLQHPRPEGFQLTSWSPGSDLPVHTSVFEEPEESQNQGAVLEQGRLLVHQYLYILAVAYRSGERCLFNTMVRRQQSINPTLL